MKIKALAEATGKSVPFVMNIQNRFGIRPLLHYPEGHAALLKKLVWLSLCSVPQKDIELLLSRERKLLEILKVDSVSGENNWFERLCTMKTGPTRLLLSGYDLKCRIDGNTIQPGLDFAERARELFTEKEMASDALTALRNYAAIFGKIQSQLALDIPAMAAALRWARRIAAR